MKYKAPLGRAAAIKAVEDHPLVYQRNGLFGDWRIVPVESVIKDIKNSPYGVIVAEDEIGSQYITIFTNEDYAAIILKEVK